MTDVFYSSAVEPPPSALSGDSPPGVRILPTLSDLQDEATWLEWRSFVPPALSVSDLVTSEETRREFLEGARLLRMDKRKRAGDGGFGPSPIQLVIADMLNAGHKFNGILEPRRTTKTTAVQCVILGRCTFRDDYMAGWTMAKKAGGQATGERFRKDIVSHIERIYPNLKDAPFIVNTSNGKEHIRWPNGSWFNVYAPGSDAFTSGAYDIAWIDEAQDATPEATEDFMTSIPPTFDGRDMPQLIGSGTAPDYRDGNLLWQLLHMAGAGVIRHGVPDDVDPEELEAWEPDDEHPTARVRELIELNHPGIGFTTRLSDVEENFSAMARKAFQTEYLGLAGEEGGTTALIPQPEWNAAGLDTDMPGVPDNFTWALAVHPDGDWASIGCAWLAKDGAAEIGLLHHQQGTQGLANKLRVLMKKYPRVPLGYDVISQATLVELEELQRGPNRPSLQPANYMDVRRSATKLLKLLRAGELRHYRQAPLDAAAEIAVKRDIGTYGGYGFGRPKGQWDADITPVEACALALHRLAEPQKKGKVEILFS